MKKSILQTKLFCVFAVIFLLASFSNRSQAQCQAGFTWNQSANNTIDFTNTSTGSSNATYFWHFGDGNTSHNANPTNLYFAPGIYWACVTMYDSGHACNTFCDSIIVTGTHHCHLMLWPTVVNASCATCADGSITLSVTGGTAPLTFNWSNGDTTHNTNGLLPGVYTVCVTDSNNCHACDTIHVGNHQSTGGCHANFSLHADTAHAHHYWAYNMSGGTPPLHYYWSWGDGSYDTVPFPGHGYAAAGMYTICLIITDADGCIDSMCITHNLQRLSSFANMVSVDVLDATTTGVNPFNSTVEFEVYPNPVSGNLFVNYNLLSSENISIRIVNVLGMELKNEKINLQQKGNHQEIFDLSSLADGIYLVQFENGTSKVSQKIIVAH